ncbi:MAG TPA: hypothetical protein DD437_02760 [Rhodobiaceae bacterium]|nr:hypothetical protein [Rhodobiaceae bacterium]|tara:strand:+ start:1623 stop:2180 length:558 start_codon:yes stop_codon:yes gene_type:complete
MSRRRPTRPKRKRFFVAGEGLSEIAFLTALEAIANSERPSIHLVKKNLKGGDPISMAHRAVREAKSDQKKGGGHKSRWAFLDADLTQGQALQDARRILATGEIGLVLQNPCFEAHLLRHFGGYEMHLPPNCAAATTALAGLWTGYTKPPIAQSIKDRIGLDDLRRYGAVEANSYMRFLTEIGVMM